MSLIRTGIRSLTMAFVAVGAVIAFAAAGTGAAGAGVVSDIHFRPGTNGASVGNSVVRGDSDAWFAEAYAGQVMTLQISSIESNAVYDVYSPSGDLLCVEETGSTIVLPESGDYLLIVSGTRGNTTYNLDVWIA